jgi:NTP pyrophosphatase (non-canonical NTP hydrolase)
MSYGFGKLNEYAERVYANATAKGFHEYKPQFGKSGQDVRHILSWLMLVTTETAEAAEAARKGDKENFAEELADICIRVFDCAEALGINLEQEIVNKMGKNEARPHRHGGKLA